MMSGFGVFLLALGVLAFGVLAWSVGEIAVASYRWWRRDPFRRRA